MLRRVSQRREEADITDIAYNKWILGLSPGAWTVMCNIFNYSLDQAAWC